MLKLTNISASIGICCLFYLFFLLLFYLTFTFHFTYLYFTFTFHRDLLLWCLFYMVYPHPGCWVLVHFHVWLSKGTLPKHTGIISPWSTEIYYIKKFTSLPPPSPLLWWFVTWNIFFTNSFRKKFLFLKILPEFLCCVELYMPIISYMHYINNFRLKNVALSGYWPCVSMSLEVTTTSCSLLGWYTEMVLVDGNGLLLSSLPWKMSGLAVPAELWLAPSPLWGWYVWPPCSS